MKTFQLTISTPDGNRFCGECVKLSARGLEGSLAVMAGHIPFVTSVKEGECVLTFADGSVSAAQMSGGILSVDVDRVTLLAGTFDFAKK